MRSTLSPFTYLLRNPGRCLPTIFVIVLAVTLVASVVSIVSSIDLTIYTLYGYNKFLTGLTPRNALVVAESELVKIRKIPELGSLYNAHSYQTQVKTIFGKMVFPLFGLEPEARKLILERCNVRLIAGRMPEEGEPEAVVSAVVAKNLGLKIGDIISKPESEDSYSPMPIKLVGLLGGDIWLGMTSRSLVDLNSPMTWSGYLAFSKNPEDQRKLDDSIDRVVNKGRARIWKFAGLVRETQSALSNLYLILNLVVGIIVVAISFVCGLLANIFFTQRLPEIATLSAIGYPRRFLLRRAIGETALLCTAGWLLGSLLTFGLLTLVKAVFLEPKGLLLNPIEPRALIFTIPLPITITLVALATLSIRLSALDPVSIIERRG